MNSELVNSIRYFLPELMLILTSVLFVFSNTVLKKLRIPGLYIAYAGLFAAILFLIPTFSYPQNRIFGSLAVFDPLSVLAKVICLLPLALFTVLKKSGEDSESESRLVFGFMFTAACMIAASSASFFLLIVSFAMIDLNMFFLMAIPLNDKKEKHVIWNYALAGMISWILIIVGSVILFGLSGSMDFYAVNLFLSLNPFNQNALLLSLLLVLAGLSFKMFLFPADIILTKVLPYLSRANFSFLIISLPATAILVLVRILVTCYCNRSPLNTNPEQLSMLPGFYWNGIIITLACIITVYAIVQLFRANELRAMAVYLVQLQTTALLIGFSAVSRTGLESSIALLIAGIIPTVILVYLLKTMQTGFGITSVKGLHGFGRRNPLMTLTMVLCVLSLAGFPLTIGFPAKINLLNAVYQSIPPWASASVLASLLAVSIHVFRLLFVLFASTDNNNTPDTDHPVRNRFLILYYVIFAIVIFFGIYFEPVIWLSQYFSKICGI